MRWRGLGSGAKDVWGRAFRERQVFVRTDGRVNFVTLSRTRQLGYAALVATFFLWSLYVTAVYFSYDARLAAGNARIAQMEKAYEQIVAERNVATEKAAHAYRDLLADLVDAQRSKTIFGDARTESEYEIASLQARNLALTRQSAFLQDEINASRKELERLTASDQTLKQQRDFLVAQLGTLNRRNGDLGGKVAVLEQKLKGAESRIEGLGQERDEATRKLGEAHHQVASLNEDKAEAVASAEVLSRRLETLGASRDRMEAERTALDRRVGDLERHLASLQSDQKALITRLSARAAGRSEEIESTIAMTGLDVNHLLVEASKNGEKAHISGGGQGGPFIAVPRGKARQATRGSVRSVEIEHVVSALERQEERREGLRNVLAHLPLAAPLDSYRLVSGFGRRIDPINGRLGMHQGVDLTADAKSPVRATAPGVVVFAGWDGRYGKMVELDHGMGIHTRYAHLSSVSVSVGHKVAAHGQIGIIGSTGRSTGRHVHYEILVDHHPYNPVKFMKAGEYVFSEN